MPDMCISESSDEALAFDKVLAGEIYTSSEIQANLEILCDDFGSRFPGTEAESRAADFLEAKLSEYGLANVHREPFEYNGWKRSDAQFSVVSPWQRDLECLSMPMSPPGRVRGRIVDVGAGAPEAFDALKGELDGNIALVSIVNPPSADRWIHRTEKYNRSILAGAKAFIFMGDEAGLGPITGTLGFNQWGMIPGIMISKEKGLMLQRMMLRSDEVEAVVETTDTQVRMTSWNIIGDVNGTDPDGEIVVIGCHYDGHDISQGAVDPISGLVATLDIARAMSLCSDRVKRTIRFVLFGVEELGLIGAHAYVNGHADELDGTRFMFNLDSAGGWMRKGLIVYGPDTRDYFRDLGLEMNENLLVDVDAFPLREPEHLSADHYAFDLAGLPCGIIGDPHVRELSGFYHTAHDTVDKVSLLNVREAGILTARLAWRVANDDGWSFARVGEEVRARRASSYEQCEACLVEKAVNALREKGTNQ